MDNVKSCVVRQCLFKNNFARKTGGGIFLALAIKYRAGKWKVNPDPIKIENCRFKNNEAGAAGQSIYSSVNLDLNNITVFSRENESNSIPCIQLKET